MNILDGIRVLDFGHAAAAPLCSRLLGDLGAEIIKIEKPRRGDGTRQMALPFENVERDVGCHYFYTINVNKKSVAIDLKSDDGKEIIYELAKTADIVIQNFAPGVIEKLGFGYNTLRTVKPDLIFCSISAYGSNGALRDYQGGDIIAQAISGIMGITGEADRPPVKVGAPITDFATGMLAFGSIMAALYHRKCTGAGQSIDCSLLNTSLMLTSNFASAVLNADYDVPRMGGAHPQLVPYQVFATKDGFIVLSVMSNKRWRNFCEAMDLAELASDGRFSTNDQRVRHRDVLIPILVERFKEATSREWIERLAPTGVAITEVLSLHGAYHQQQVADNNMVTRLKHPTLGDLDVLSTPFKLSGSPGEVRMPPPMLGQHTREVLVELGFSDEQIGRLLEDEVIGCSG